MRITALARSQGVEAAKQAFREMEDSLEPVSSRGTLNPEP